MKDSPLAAVAISIGLFLVLENVSFFSGDNVPPLFREIKEENEKVYRQTLDLFLFFYAPSKTCYWSCPFWDIFGFIDAIYLLPYCVWFSSACVVARAFPPIPVFSKKIATSRLSSNPTFHPFNKNSTKAQTASKSLREKFMSASGKRSNASLVITLNDCSRRMI